jgi:hypothetical protein
LLLAWAWFVIWRNVVPLMVTPCWLMQLLNAVSAVVPMTGVLAYWRQAW